MESVVKLYSLPYSNVKTYGAALLFVVGNIALPQLFHSSIVPFGASGRDDMVAHLFLHLGRRLQVRLEGRFAYRYRFSVDKFGIVRHARSGGASGHLAEVRPVSCRCRLRGPSFPKSVGVGSVGCSVILSMCRHFGRMGILCRQLPCSRPGFSHRHPRHVAPSLRRLCLHPLFD